MFKKKKKYLEKMKELEKLKQEKLDRISQEVTVLRKCINACANAIDMNQKAMLNVVNRVENVEGKVDDKLIDKEIDEMFG